MAKRPRKESVEAIETRPDGWQQFERAVDAAVKSGPKHRVVAKAKAKKPTKPRGRRA